MKTEDKKILLRYIENNLKRSTNESFYIHLTNKMFEYILELIKTDLEVKK